MKIVNPKDKRDSKNFQGDMVKLTWKNLMDYYNELQKRYNRIVAAGMDPPEFKWQFFHMLHFARQDKAFVKRKYNYMQPSKVGL